MMVKSVVAGFILVSLLKPGAELPRFALRDISGKIVYRSDICSPKAGGAVVIDFFATWCKPCIRALKVMEKLKGEFASKKLKIYLIAYRQKPEEISKFFKEKWGSAPFPVLFDPYGEVSDKFGVTALPRTFIVDAYSCKISHVIYGEQKDLYKILKVKIDQILKNKR